MLQLLRTRSADRRAAGRRPGTAGGRCERNGRPRRREPPGWRREWRVGMWALGWAPTARLFQGACRKIYVLAVAARAARASPCASVLQEISVSALVRSRTTSVTVTVCSSGASVSTRMIANAGSSNDSLGSCRGVGRLESADRAAPRITGSGSANWRISPRGTQHVRYFRPSLLPADRSVSDSRIRLSRVSGRLAV